jgi:hypothetical protein
MLGVCMLSVVILRVKALLMAWRHFANNEERVKDEQVEAGKPYQRERINTVHLLVLTCADRLLFD